ncbi:M28 family peptidase [Pseudonocardia sp. KRD291]|uniref:M28 family peptidase n=1 Tax=Pseudonocardia sp. KRD291 TaxID=2792007 RepID=UPI001C4A15F0|nr:M28 family peptidase [Pseudonocardia sp. KRD291]MBW0106413.1 M28 family peptidase [Pseudonocardia sp. KRD291]
MTGTPGDPPPRADARKGHAALRGHAVLLVAVLLLVAAAAAAVVTARPPAPAAAAAPPGAFSATRAMGSVAALADRPRPVGSPASDRARDGLAARLRAMGLQTSTAPSVGASSREGRQAVGAVENVVATRRGTAPTGAVVLMAHYDSVPAGPGAADDGSAVASILETVRALSTGPALRNDLVVLLTDGEEAGLLGAQAFTRADPLRGRPAVVLNWEARGSGGASMLFQTSPGNARLIEAYRAVPHPAGDSSTAAAYALLPNDTDLTPFLAAGRPGMNSAFVERASRYHTPGDTPANLDPTSVQQQGTSMLALTRVLGAADLVPFDPAVSGAPASGDVTFAAVFGHLWAYPDTYVLPLAVLAALAVAGAVVLARRRDLLSIGRFGGALASWPVAVLLAALLGEGAWRVLASSRAGYANSAGVVHRPGLAQVAILLLGLLALLLWGVLLRRRLGAWAMGLAATAWLAVLGLLTAVLVPGASFLVALPALGAGLGIAVAATVPAPWRPLPVAVGGLGTAVLLVPFSVALFDAAGLAGSALSAACVVLGLAPLAALVAGRRLPARVPAAVLVAAVALGALGLVVDRPDAAHPDRADLAYLHDTDSGTARWVSRDPVPAPWTARYVTGEPTAPGRDLPWPGDTPVRTGPAPVVALPAPAATVRRLPGGAVELRVGSRRGADVLGVRADTPGVTSAEVTYVGRAPVALPVRGLLDLQLLAVPRGGARIVLRTDGVAPLRLVVRDQTTGLSGISGWTPRPPGLERSPTRDGDTLVITRSVTG